MADIRINALATTAASTASDDFVAVDGTAQGTRKLSAYSPSFGGNLTVTGNINPFTIGPGYTGFAGSIGILGGNGLFIQGKTGTTYDFAVGNNAGSVAFGIPAGTTNVSVAGNLTVSGTISTSGVVDFAVNANSTQVFTIQNTSTGVSAATRFTMVAGTSSGSIQLYGSGNSTPNILQFASPSSQKWLNNGAEMMSLSSTGNLLLGTTTDTGEKLQVNGTGYFAGALIQLGNATVDALYRVSASNGKSSDFGDDTTGGFVRANNSQSLRFITAGNIVLTLDSSANATFAGKVVVSGTGIAMGGATNPAVQGVYTAGLSTYFLANSGGNVNLGNASNGSLVVINSSGDITMTSGAALKLGNAYVAGAPTATGYVVIKDSTGTSYKIPAVAL